LDALTSQVREFWCPTIPVRAGDVVVDVGAGAGDHVLVFARWVGPAGRVVAVEAHPLTAECLRLTVDANKLSNTLVLAEAAWNTSTKLRISDENAHEANAVGDSGDGITVPARPVDDMLAPLALARIDLIKLNVEGAELEALAGMPRALATARAIVVSCHDFLADRPDDPRRTKARVIPFLEACGFTVTQQPNARHAFARDYVYGRRL
jgi:FkbM family methyltransferase